MRRNTQQQRVREKIQEWKSGLISATAAVTQADCEGSFSWNSTQWSIWWSIFRSDVGCMLVVVWIVVISTAIPALLSLHLTREEEKESKNSCCSSIAPFFHRQILKATTTFLVSFSHCAACFLLCSHFFLLVFPPLLLDAAFQLTELVFGTRKTQRKIEFVRESCFATYSTTLRTRYTSTLHVLSSKQSLFTLWPNRFLFFLLGSCLLLVVVVVVFLVLNNSYTFPDFRHRGWGCMYKFVWWWCYCTLQPQQTKLEKWDRNFAV